MSSVVGLSLGVDYKGHNQSQHGDRNWLEEWVIGLALCV